MKSILDEIPKLMELTLKKVEETQLNKRPETAKAMKKLLKNMQSIGKEFANLSSKYGEEPKKPKRPPAVLAKNEDRQLSFDFMKK